MLIIRSALAQTHDVQPESRQTQGMAAALLLALCLVLPHATAAASEAPMMLALTSASAQPQVQAASQKRAVDLNSASAEQLASTLVGVSTVKAQAIIRYRDKVGPFRLLEELEEVKGIGPNTVKR
jgi:competence protein ComEA